MVKHLNLKLIYVFFRYYLSDPNPGHPQVHGPSVITAEIFDVLRLFLDLRMLHRQIHIIVVESTIDYSAYQNFLELKCSMAKSLMQTSSMREWPQTQQEVKNRMPEEKIKHAAVA